MNIAIEARSISNPGSGIRTYTARLIEHLLRLAPQHTYHIIYDDISSVGTFPDAQEYVVPLLHPLALPWWLNHQIPTLLNKIVPDITHFTKASVPNKMTVPTVTTIHDVIPLIYPQSQSLLRRWYWPRTLSQAAYRSDHLITISEASKKDIARLFAVAPEKITVTPLAVDRSYFKPITDETVLQAVAQKYSLKRPYIFFLGTRDPRKNVPGLIRAFQSLVADFPHQLVIAGKEGVTSDHAQATINALHLENSVRLLDFVNFADLPALLSAAQFFVWPSIYEGWGFPPLEAMACGTPTIVSNGGALPEVVGDAGVSIPFSTDIIADRVHDSDFEQRLTQAMRETMQSESRRFLMRSEGLAQVEKFSWESVAKATLEIYEKVGG